MSDARKDEVFPFYSLPTELRYMVIEARLIVNIPITPLIHHVHATQRLIPLACVNKDIQVQAYKAYYRHNTFIFRTMHQYLILGDPKQSRFMYPEPQMGNWIQNLTIELNVSLNSSSRLEKMLNFPEEWRYLLRPDDQTTKLLDIEPRVVHRWAAQPPPNNQAMATRWQGHFPNLQTLKIVLIMKETSCRTAIPSAHRFGIWQNRAKIHVHARNVEVEIRGCVCEQDFTEGMVHASDGICDERYQNAVKRMVHAWMA
ncbi:hypothetical protein FB567DRAFT_551387 [Paraphoma chrysanthemicola]|uniref:Uncharacterized protein n=1 Tax=Paraphoma chrysanthemicola TaxID=798071 RepID=A0A8K0R0D1_9PLEO|nr:hypothetical protein FB567DRAFT_599788 [Paraphoma chrysanthemicola]KAH7082441.1 hypothetical protein FB567DRAFT_551387 [Paraphoma chrysanthemicola]